MADVTSFQIPNNPTFEDALKVTGALLDHMATTTFSESEIQAAIASLVATENGARGFFVMYLSDERSLADQPTLGVLEALKTSSTIISPLLVKNLAMSTAMAITHRRNQNEDQAQGSERVQRRSMNLIRQLDLPEVKEQAIALLESVNTHTGSYEPFLNRWHYDTEQREAIRRTLEQANV